MPATFLTGLRTWFVGLPTVGKVVTAATAVVVSGVVGTAIVAPGRETTAVVLKVVDGDTVDVRFRGHEERVRLLNVDTPETVDPDAPVECLGPEASEFLSSALPVGTRVRLAFDHDLRDRYGRLLAGVYRQDVLLNADIARRGLGVAVVYEPNDRFYPAVQAAAQEAVQAGTGLYDQDVECTLTSQVAEFEEEVQDLAEPLPASVVALDSQLEHIAALVATADALRSVIDAPDVFPAVAYPARTLRGWSARLDVRSKALDESREATNAARDRELDRIAEERRAAEEAARVAAEAEAARLAAESEAARVAAEQAEKAAAEKAAADAAAAARRAAPKPKPPASGGGSSGGSSGGDSGYTGCRAYAPGGKTWKPIPCGG